MYNEKIEALIKAALADGVVTEKEKQVLFKRAEAEGVDLDEFEMVLDARLVELKKEGKKQSSISTITSNKYNRDNVHIIKEFYPYDDKRLRFLIVNFKNAKKFFL